LVAFASIDDEDLSEQAFYDNMPPELYIFTTDSLPTTQAPFNGCATTSALNQKWIGIAPPTDGDITFNLAANAPIDYDDRDGIASGHASFEGTLYHELFHLLGFGSGVNPGFNVMPEMTDLFRLVHETVGNTVSATELYEEPRMMANDYETVMGLALSVSGGAPRMSTGVLDPFYGGDGFTPAHWKSVEHTGVNLGIMEPKAIIPPAPGYLSTVDLRALDIIGWNLEPSAEVVLAATIDDSSQIVATTTPTLTWDSAGLASTAQSCVIYNDSDLAEAHKLYEAANLSYSLEQATIPSGNVVFGHTYYWLVTTYNDNGVAFSDTGSFTARNPLCPCDFNGDDLVDDSDFTTLVVAYNLLDCESPGMPANCVADINGDGAVDDTDFSIFVVAYNNLVCP